MTTRTVALRDLPRALAALIVLAGALVALACAVAAPAGAATPETTPAAELAQGAGMGDHPSTAVRRVQTALAHRGYSLGAPGIDGRFGPLTDNAVRQYQADEGLVVDGMVGRHTRSALRLPTDATSRHRASRESRRHTSNQHTGNQHSGNQHTRNQAQPVVAHTPQTSGRDGVSLWALALSAALGAFCSALVALGLTARRRTPSLATPTREDIPQSRARANHGHALSPAQTENTESKETSTDDTSTLPAGAPVIGYVTLARDAGSDELQQPAAQIDGACHRAGWQLVDVITDRENGRGLQRPGLTYALRQIAQGKARALIIADLRRLTGSVTELGALLDWFGEADAHLIALDLDLDTTNARGRHTANTLIALSGWERDRIATRTRTGLAQARAKGASPGRPAVSDRPELAHRINAMRAQGMTLQAIADRLNDERIPTIRGGAEWRPSSVQAALGYRRPGTRKPHDQLPDPQQRR